MVWLISLDPERRPAQHGAGFIDHVANRVFPVAPVSKVGESTVTNKSHDSFDYRPVSTLLVNASGKENSVGVKSHHQNRLEDSVTRKAEEAVVSHEQRDDTQIFM